MKLFTQVFLTITTLYLTHTERYRISCKKGSDKLLVWADVYKKQKRKPQN